MADLSILVAQEVSEARDVIFGITRSVQSQNARSAGLEENPLHVTDSTPLPRLNPQPIGVTDEPVKVADTVVNAFTSTDLSVVVSTEVSKARDVIFGITRFVASQNALSAGLQENPLHLSEERLDFFTGTTEVLKVVDTVTVLANPLQAAPAVESLKVQDGTPSVSGLTNTDLNVNLTEPLRVSDQPPFIEERLKVVDTVTASLVFTPSLTVSLTENLRLNDQPPFIQERLKVQDTVTAALAAAGGDLSRAVADEVLHLADFTGDLSTGLEEILRVQDTVTPAMGGNLTIAVADENLKVQDTVTTSLTVLLASVTDESLKIADTVTLFENPLFAAPATENLKVQDTVIASTGGLIAVLGDEVLKVQDSVSASLTVLFLAVTDEPLKIADTVTAQLDTLLVSLTESLKVQDQVTASSGGLIATPGDENLKVQDTVSASLTVLLLTAPTESMRVFDTDLTVTETGAGQVNVQDSLKVQDSVTAQLDTLLVTVTQESLKVQDTVTPALERSVVITQESLKVQDTVTASVGLSTALGDETLKVQDTVSTQLTVLRASASESLKVQDFLTLGVNLLSVNVTTEVLHLQDFVLTPAVPDVTVRVRGDIEIIHIRQDVGTILV